MGEVASLMTARKRKSKRSALLMFAAALTLIVSACSSTSAGSGAKTKKVIVGTVNVFPGVAFLDETGNLTGFDVELAKELDKRLPEFEFEIQTMDFGNLLLSLEAGKIDFVMSIMSKNEEREKKYLFNKEPYAYFFTRVAVDIANDTIRSIEDLRGKKLFIGSATSSNASFIQAYNEEHGNPIEIVYGSGGANDLVQLIRTGRVDATLQTDFSVRFETDADGNPALKLVGEPLIADTVHYVLRKDSQELADKLDEALRAVKEDGTLAKLSIEWLGQDFTIPLEEAR